MGGCHYMLHLDRTGNSETSDLVTYKDEMWG